MLWKSYRSLSHRERALVDGRLITYHFYVGGITLALLGLIDAFRAGAHEKLGLVVAGLALAWGLTAIVIGVALHFVHRWMIRSPQRDEYLAIVTVVVWQGYVLGLEETSVSDMLRIPRAPFKFLVGIGGSLLWLELLIDFVDSIRKVARGAA